MNTPELKKQFQITLFEKEILITIPSNNKGAYQVSINFQEGKTMLLVDKHGNQHDWFETGVSDLNYYECCGVLILFGVVHPTFNELCKHLKLEAIAEIQPIVTSAATESYYSFNFSPLFSQTEDEEYGSLMLQINCTEYGDTEENNNELEYLDTILKEREIIVLSSQLSISDKHQRVSNDNENLFVIGIFDINGIFDDYHDCIDMNERYETDCYRDLITLNGKIPIV